MSYPKPLDKMDPSEPPPACVLADGTPEQAAFNTAKGFVTQVYAAIDAGAAAQLPFRPDSTFCFQKGAADRFQGQALLPRLQQMHKGMGRDLSGLSTQVFPGNSILCVVAGAMTTAASTQASQHMQVLHRFADFFMVGNDAQGPHLKCGVMRELDEDCGPAPAGAAQGEQFQKADQIAQQFLPFFYGSLDDPSKRGGLNQMFKDISYLTVAQDLFKGSQHIAHKIHYLPQLASPAARKIEGADSIPSPAGGYFVFVHGNLQLAGEERPMRFIDVFHLMPEGGNFWVSNCFMKVHGGV